MTLQQYNELMDAYHNASVTMILVVDTSAIGGVDFTFVFDPTHADPFFIFGNISNDDVIVACIRYNLDMTLYSADYLPFNGGEIINLADYADVLTTTLYVYWHPIPN